MGLIFIDAPGRLPRRQWRDIETCVSDLLTPYQDCGQGELEFMREEINHMRDCLARFMVRKDLSTDDLNQIFYTDIELKEDPDA